MSSTGLGCVGSRMGSLQSLGTRVGDEGSWNVKVWLLLTVNPAPLCLDMYSFQGDVQSCYGKTSITELDKIATPNGQL